MTEFETQALELLREISLKMDKLVFDPYAPTNQYGEGLSEGIQMAIVRGQRGIDYNYGG